MNQLHYNIARKLCILKGLDLASIFISIKNIEDKTIKNLNNDIKKLNNISKFNIEESMIIYDAENILFSEQFSLENLYKQLKIDFTYTSDEILLLNKLAMCVNILYNNRNDEVLSAVMHILIIFNQIINNKLGNILFIHNTDIKKINAIIIHSIYNEIKSDLNCINEKISNINNSYLGINNINLNELIRGNKYILSYISKFLAQYMIERMHTDEQIKYINIFKVLYEVFNSNELIYNNIISCDK